MGSEPHGVESLVHLLEDVSDFLLHHANHTNIVDINEVAGTHRRSQTHRTRLVRRRLATLQGWSSADFELVDALREEEAPRESHRKSGKTWPDLA